MIRTKTYKHIKIKDVSGFIYAFDDCMMDTVFGEITIYEKGPAGMATHIFYKKNLIEFSFVE